MLLITINFTIQQINIIYKGKLWRKPLLHIPYFPMTNGFLSACHLSYFCHISQHLFPCESRQPQAQPAAPCSHSTTGWMNCLCGYLMICTYYLSSISNNRPRIARTNCFVFQWSHHNSSSKVNQHSIFPAQTLMHNNPSPTTTNFQPLAWPIIMITLTTSESSKEPGDSKFG